MTEEEARKKVCPFLGSKILPLHNNRVETSILNCIASDCMAWRWLDLVHDADQGYCGLAGKP